MRPCSRENQISYLTFCQMGGCLNSSLVKKHTRYGTTYHHIGYGVMVWKQNKPKGPPHSDRMAMINKLVEL